jgi:hypothetical protein
MYPLSTSFGFNNVAISTTPVSKDQTPLPLFPIEAVSVGDANHVLAEVEMEAERFLGCFCTDYGEAPEWWPLEPRV